MKRLIKSKLVQALLLAFTIIGLYFAYQAYRRHELTQFVMWSPRAKIASYEFMDDNKAVAIDWDRESELKEAEEAKKYDNRIKVELSTATNGERFIVRQSYKLKSATYKYWILEEDAVPYLKSNIPEQGEYWLLDVYDTKDGTIKQKTYDVFQMVREYNKDYIPIGVAESSKLLQSENEKDYLPIKMAVNSESSAKTFIGIIDLTSGKILSETPSRKSGKEFYDVFKNTIKNRDNFEDIINQNDRLSNQNFTLVLSNFFLKKSVSSDQVSSLADKYPKVFSILKSGPSSRLYFLGKEDVHFKISLLKLVLPEGTNIFKDINIPVASS